MKNSLPLISVIIPAYNYALFLPKAISSVMNQTYRNFEVIVVDDGSTDHTKLVVEENEWVHYFYQENKGISAARNTGIEKAKGDYLVFLDADDWLEQDALEQNYRVIKDNPDVAFVSGNYYFLRADTNVLCAISVTVTHNHYSRLLQSNYIGMQAAILFRRWVFDEIRYDETLPFCEDYDLYLRIARKYPVIHHQQFIATYYFHSSGLSHNYKGMMDSIITVMNKQAPYICTREEEIAYAEGLQQWKEYDQLMKAFA